MKVVVTGAAGFIGGNLCRELLLNSDLEVVGIDSFTDYYDPKIKRLNVASMIHPRFTLHEVDLGEADLMPILRGATAVFHQAGQPGVRKSWGQDFSIYTRHNISATQRLLEAAKNTPSLKSFVYASSSSVYGDAVEFPTDEMDLPAPVSPYGVSKLAAEHLVTLYAKNFDLPAVSLRYFTVYGPGQRPDMAFNRFIRAGLNGSELSIFGDGEQIREFTHVTDIVAANLAVLQRTLVPGSVINLSGGTSITVNGALQIIESILGRNLNIQHRNKIPGDVFRTGGSTTRARTLLGWTPKVAIREGLESQVAWMRGLSHGLLHYSEKK
ncbi:NAD-dependent epimerase/dehydratase family protein [Pseudarthrobacter sp. TAF60_1]|uniref:NAD-dependent epimerase/dehydratase family protein n=1 Tax=Pseudarthrobacter sp. TAF60_1 TaxID=3233071 RepID=UPI003F98C033